MSHEDEGHYAAKHSDEVEINRSAAESIKQRSSNDKLTCVEAHAISSELGIAPSEVGKTLDLMEIRIIECQLGFFGYEGADRSIVKPAEKVPDQLKDRILKEVEDNRVSCLSLWTVADEMNISKMNVSAACETLKLKVCCCQLGAF